MKPYKPLTLILALLMLIAPMVALKPALAQHGSVYFTVEPHAIPTLNGTISGSDNQNIEINPTPNPVGQEFTVEIYMRNATVANVPNGVSGVNVYFNITNVIGSGYVNITAFQDYALNIWPDALTTRDGLYWFDSLNVDHKVNATGYDSVTHLYDGLPTEYEWAGASGSVAYNAPPDALIANLTFTVFARPSSGNPAVDLPLVLDYNDYVQTFAIDFVTSNPVPPIPPILVNGNCILDAAPLIVTLPPGMTLFVQPQHYVASATGEIFAVSVVLTADVGWDVAGFDINFTYDPVQLGLVSLSQGTFLVAGGDTTWGFNDTSVPGRVWMVAIKLSDTVPSGGTGTLFTMTFKALTNYTTPPPTYPMTIAEYDIVGWPHPERHYAPWNSIYAAELTPYVTVINGDYTPPYLPTGPSIDLYTLGSPGDSTYPWGPPFDGSGANQHSDAFAPQQLVCLYTKVTYGGYPVGNKLVTFEIHDASGAKITILAAYTNWSDADPAHSGIAKVCFRIPMTNTFDNGSAPTILGWWWVTSTVDLDSVVVNDTMYFQVGYLFTVLNVVPNGAPYHLPSGIMSFTVTVQTISEQPRNALISVDEYDVSHYPIGEQVYWLMGVNATRGTCPFTGNATTTIPGIFINTVTAPVPSWARAGLATVIAYPLTDYPRNGGISWGPSASNTFALVYP